MYLFFTFFWGNGEDDFSTSLSQLSIHDENMNLAKKSSKANQNDLSNIVDNKINRDTETLMNNSFEEDWNFVLNRKSNQDIEISTI